MYMPTYISIYIYEYVSVCMLRDARNASRARVRGRAVEPLVRRAPPRLLCTLTCD